MKNYIPNEIIYKEGDSTNDIFFIKQGSVEVL